MNHVKEQTGWDQNMVRSAPSAANKFSNTSPGKRKRANFDFAETAGDRMRLRIDHAFICSDEPETGNESPRTQISTNLSELRLQADACPSHQGNPRSREDAGELLGQAPIASCYPQNESRLEPALNSTSSSTDFRPSTPNFLPVVSATNAQVISPLSYELSTSHLSSDSLAADDAEAAALWVGAPMSGFSRTRDANADLSKVLRSLSPLTSRIRKPRKRRKSPPPSAVINDLVWSDVEITGHDPDDPNDDGYGINGIGFRPTPAIAEQRRTQRRRQIAEWKRREDVEKRAGRRKARSGGIQTCSDSEGATSSKHVRFVESKALGAST